MAVSMTCLMFFCFINHLFTQQDCQGESPEIYISWAGLKIPLSTMLPKGSWLGCIGKVAKQLKTVPETPHTHTSSPDWESRSSGEAFHKWLQGQSEESLWAAEVKRVNPALKKPLSQKGHQA